MQALLHRGNGARGAKRAAYGYGFSAQVYGFRALWWRVRHPGGDWEELNRREVAKGVAVFIQRAESATSSEMGETAVESSWPLRLADEHVGADYHQLNKEGK